MDRLIGIIGAIGAAAVLSFISGAAWAEPGGDPLVMQARQAMDRYTERGTWSNPIAAAAANENDGAQSADTVMAVTLAGYSRALLDRGGWLNPYVNSRTYDAGHPLLASVPGDGATTTR